MDAETYGVMTLENRMATFFNSQVWCSMKPLSITRARNTVQLPVLEPFMYSRQTCQSPHALAMLSPLSSPSRNTAASPSGRTSLHKRPSLHNWHERRISTDCGQRNRPTDREPATLAPLCCACSLLARCSLHLSSRRRRNVWAQSSKRAHIRARFRCSLASGHQAPLTNVLMPTRRRAAGGIRRR